jgi:hypothetical protein
MKQTLAQTVVDSLDDARMMMSWTKRTEMNAVSMLTVNKIC